MEKITWLTFNETSILIGPLESADINNRLIQNVWKPSNLEGQGDKIEKLIRTPNQYWHSLNPPLLKKCQQRMEWRRQNAWIHNGNQTGRVGNKASSWISHWLRFSGNKVAVLVFSSTAPANLETLRKTQHICLQIAAFCFVTSCILADVYGSMWWTCSRHINAL
jgi:hypothetical protein